MLMLTQQIRVLINKLIRLNVFDYWCIYIYIENEKGEISKKKGGEKIEGVRRGGAHGTSGKLESPHLPSWVGSTLHAPPKSSPKRTGTCTCPFLPPRATSQGPFLLPLLHQYYQLIITGSL